ncbi:MAG TPA: SRPBCC family protein [Actinomycetales bacterium]|nr:SRPBCC family protein [Actinomycetales bacterium]
MEMRHEFTVPIPVAEAWATFNDLEKIAPCFPGAQITSVDGDDFTGLAKVKLGPIALQYTGTGHWNERDATAYRAVITASGKDKRGNGTASATVTAHLEEAGSGTKVVVETDLKITGRPAQFGRGLIQDVGTKLLDQFAACLATTFDAADPPAASAEVAAPATISADATVPSTQAELDLGSVVLPTLARRFGPTALACVVTAVVVWVVARRR